MNLREEIPDWGKFYEHVPRERSANLIFRRKLITEASGSLSDQRNLRNICRRDPLFFFSVFLWVYDPNDRTEDPFIPFHYQERLLRRMFAAMGDYDLWIRKSRKMGGSFLCVFVPFWPWMFDDKLFVATVISRKDELVDHRGDPNTLFAKLDHQLAKLPSWIMPEEDRDRKDGLFLNEVTGSVIHSETTTGHSARGSRPTVAILDEYGAFDLRKANAVMAATRGAVHSRIMNSTASPVVHPFHEKTKKKSYSVAWVHWKEHPVYSRGLEMLPDGRWTSPWYRDEVARCVHPLEAANELDMESTPDHYQFFPPELIAKLRDKARPPLRRGRLDVDERTNRIIGFRDDSGGPLRLWCDLGALGRPDDTYDCVVGADVSMGTGASNSAFVVIQKQTGRVLAEWADPRVSPEEFGRLCYAVQWWFCDRQKKPAKLNFEFGGPGVIFWRAFADCGGSDVYYHRDEKAIGAKISAKPGWRGNHVDKKMLLSDYRTALDRGDVDNPSLDSVTELGEYTWVYDDGNPKIKHRLAESTEDPTGAEENHGDRVIAAALGWWLCRGVALERYRLQNEEAKASCPEGPTLENRIEAHARRESEDQARRKTYDWRNLHNDWKGRNGANNWHKLIS